jgi:hypothetical protein
MLTTISPNLQKQYEHMDAYTMIQGMCGMFENQARAERYNISKALFACRLAGGSPASPHVFKMMDYIETLDKLGCEIKDDLTTDMILQSLPVSYELFICMAWRRLWLSYMGCLKLSRIALRRIPNHVMMVQK